MFHKTAAVFILLLLTLLCFDCNAQACRFSMNTIYVKDVKGNTIRNVTITVTRKDPHDVYNSHFREASKTIWDDERKAHVFQHGLCGSHREVVLRVAAKGFEVVEHMIDLPLGWQAFALTLKHKDSQEQSNFKALTCAEGTSVCASTPLL